MLEEVRRSDAMTDIDRIDLSELRAMWERRRRAAEEVRRRIDPTGMTKPARDPEEAAFLREIGKEGPFLEVEMPGWREWVTNIRREAWRYSPYTKREDAPEPEDNGG
jgi:hypothetical protein